MGAIDPTGSFNPAPIYRQVSILEAFSNSVVSIDAPRKPRCGLEAF